MRRLALEAGRRMTAAGLLAEPGEVALLGFDELLDWLRGASVDVAGSPSAAAAPGPAPWRRGNRNTIP